jgi:hypothetical protein
LRGNRKVPRQNQQQQQYDSLHGVLHLMKSYSLDADYTFQQPCRCLNP